MSEANREQASRWNESSGPTWVEMQEVLDEMFEVFEKRVVDEGFPGEGRCVLDVGCGSGATTIAMAQRLGPEGLCVGIDISRPLIAAANLRAARSGLGSLRFVEADAQTYEFAPKSFDAVISRFGVMFFDDPTSAFANIRNAARERAGLTFVAWRSAAENDFIGSLVRALEPLLPAMPSVDPDAPGQFAFARAERVRTILENSGWTDIAIDAMDVLTSATELNLLAYLTMLGPVGMALKKVDESTRARVIAAARAAIAPHIEHGLAHFPSACWLVTARA